MAWTKPTFYISVVTIVLLFFISLSLAGTELASNSRINLNEKSIDYINTIKGQNANSNFNTYADAETSDTQTTDILQGSNETTVSTENDYLSTLYVKKERASNPTNYFKVAYNIPSSIIIGLGLNISDFQHIINIATYALLVAILVLVWTRLINV